ncbi:MAG: baseplate hub protein [Methylocystis sp.]|uniref:baseplate hub protein n=1 Tax=Methylocystis sp. TaxID=1911079 RepID=UPI003DA2D321
MIELDPRLLRISVEVNGVMKAYDQLNMRATGTKFANANQNECEVVLTNLDKATRDFLLTETSPFNATRTPKRFIVEAGRVSYGLVKIFEGVIASVVPTQPPDISVTIKALTGNDKKSEVIATAQPAQTSLRRIASQVASDLGLGLAFQATDKQIANYNFTGGALKQVDKLGEVGAVDAFVDDSRLIVKNRGAALTGQLRVLNVDTGMIGIPEVTERGVKVKYLLDNSSVLGGALRLESAIYPTVNGDYTIYKLGFDIANRDTPFYWIAEASRNGR